MTIIEIKNLKDVLKAAQQQFTSISIQNPNGEWPSDYFIILEIKDIKTSSGPLTLIILQSSENKLNAVDLKMIKQARFNKYLDYKGGLIEMIEVLHRRVEVLM